LLLGRRTRSIAVIGRAQIAHEPDDAQHQPDRPKMRMNGNIGDPWRSAVRL
jgi:hypothetical protein